MRDVFVVEDDWLGGGRFLQSFFLFKLHVLLFLKLQHLIEVLLLFPLKQIFRFFLLLGLLSLNPLLLLLCFFVSLLLHLDFNLLLTNLIIKCLCMLLSFEKGMSLQLVLRKF